MKKILLIGDSIRQGYDNYVKESMENIAEVYFPDDNCRYTTYILRCIHEWATDLGCNDADLVHWNAGLWDTLKIYNDDCLINIDTYVENIERIIKRINFLFPNAKIIFATSTPVLEKGFIEDFEMRYNADVERYNEAACNVLKKYDVIINDLYSLLKDVPESYHSDQTHFYTAEATELIGGRVLDVICRTLNIDKALLKTPDKTKYNAEKSKSDNEIYIKNGDYYEIIKGI